MSSRSKLNQNTIRVIYRVPLSALDGGTSVDHILYYLYMTLHMAEELVDDTTYQYLETALRRIVTQGIVDSTMFDSNGNIKRSVLKGE